jgi:hypothetical protein
VSKARAAIPPVIVIAVSAALYFALVPSKAGSGYFADARPAYDELATGAEPLLGVLQNEDEGGVLSESGFLLLYTDTHFALRESRTSIGVSKFDTGSLEKSQQDAEEAISEHADALTDWSAPPLVSGIGEAAEATEASRIADDYVAGLRSVTSRTADITEYQQLLLDTARAVYKVTLTKEPPSAVEDVERINAALESALEGLQNASVPAGFEEIAELEESTLQAILLAYEELEADLKTPGPAASSARVALSDALNSASREANRAAKDIPIVDESHDVEDLGEELEEALEG